MLGVFGKNCSFSFAIPPCFQALSLPLLLKLRRANFIFIGSTSRLVTVFFCLHVVHQGQSGLVKHPKLIDDHKMKQSTTKKTHGSFNFVVSRLKDIVIDQKVFMYVYDPYVGILIVSSGLYK